ncbi:XRE family transcriptional regulator [Paracoccus denitrificans]|uniref:XRE family transcriptional regulator n=1 Tax=Paracoccus denitrificans TaxID=266 RepID=UPI003365048E
MTQRELSSVLGVSKGYIGDIEAGRSPPSRNFLQNLSERFGVSADWILYGTGLPYTERAAGFEARLAGKRIEPPDLGSPWGGDLRFAEEGFAFVQRMDLDVSAGSGVVPIDGGESETLAFSTKWLGRNGINSQLAVLVRVKGDSMAPGIPDGALAMVHLPERTVEREGIYAFNRGDQSFIKRLIPSGRDEAGMPTSLVILSDNPAFPPDAVTGEQMNEIRIVGRVRCVMTTL